MIRTRIARAAVIGGITAAAVLGTAGAAFAQQDAGGVISPGSQLCTDKQYAGFQVKGVLDKATGQGVTLRLYKGSTIVVELGPGTMSGSVQRLPATFTGAGNYKVCAYDSGAVNSKISGLDANGQPSSLGLHLYTDNEVH